MASTIFILASFGIVALIAELVVPGGILGVIGLGCLVVAAGLSFFEYGLVVGLIASVTLVILSVGALWLWMKYFHVLPGTRKLVLKGQNAPGDSRTERESLVGRTGRTLTDLSPSGRAVFGNRRVDVISESAAIGRDRPIEVLRRSGGGPGWVVRAVTEGEE